MCGSIQTTDDVKFSTFEQLGGDMLRLDIFKNDSGKGIECIEQFRNYNVVDKWDNGDRITHYIRQRKESYTDNTGVTYRTSSAYVYTDKNGSYRSFSDDTKEHLSQHEKQLSSLKYLLEKAEIRGDFEDVDRCKRWIKDREILIEKCKKDLMKGI